MQFSTLGLSEPLLKSLKAQNFQQPYPIQQKAIPAILAGKDIFGVAQTGSGKTAAFVLPVLELLQKSSPPKSRYIKVLVLVPTRELAAQVADVFQTFSNGLSRRLNTQAVYGGVSINPQMMALSSAEIVVATPGRLLDLVSSNAVHLSAIEVLILDEADKILNLGFQEEIDKIFALLPENRQNVLFSATIGDDIRNIKETLLRDPLLIEVKEENQQQELISQVAYHVAPERKGVLLRYLIKQQNMQQVLVFTSSIRTADNLVGKLSKNGIQASSLHSQKTQGARTEVLAKFKSGKLRVLVATDLASRGIDIEKLPYVFNFELPRSPKDYVHRIGRTGRASTKGEAISLITAEDQHHFKIIQKKMGKKVSIVETDDLDLKGY
jgi:ATP-dependent RNA helicase RhlE